MSGVLAQLSAWLAGAEAWLGALGPAAAAWLDAHSGTASWLQAAGVLVALGLAIAVPARLHRRESAERLAERRAEAASLAAAIHPELAEVAAGLEPVATKIQALSKDLTEGRTRIPIAMGAGYFSIGEAPVLRASVLRLHVLGEKAGTAAQRVAAQLAQYERLIMEVESRVNQAIHARDTEYTGLRRLAAAIEALKQPLQQALERVKPLP